MESITIKVENELAKEIEREMRPFYSTKTEFIREAIRDKLKIIKKEKHNEKLRELFGKSTANTSFEQDRLIRAMVGKKFASKRGVALK